MATQTAAEDAASSCSQKAAYKATTMAIQIRNANAHEARGKPVKRGGARTVVTLIEGTRAAHLLTPSIERALRRNEFSFEKIREAAVDVKRLADCTSGCMHAPVGLSAFFARGVSWLLMLPGHKRVSRLGPSA